MFCPKCGATDKDFYKGFCIDCYLESHTLVEFPEKFTIVECRNCGGRLHNNRWVEDSYPVLQKLALEKIKTELVAPEVEVELKEKAAVLRVTGFLDTQKQFSVTREKEVPLIKEQRICSSCVKFSDKFYELKLQLRNAEPTDLVLYKEISRFIRKTAHLHGRSDPRAKAFWWEEEREGTDFFFGFRQAGEAVISEIGSAFRIHPESRSNKILGIAKNGKKKVRFTYCIRV